MFCTLIQSPIQISTLLLVGRYLKILDDMTMVRIYVKTSTSTKNVANHRAKGGWCNINFLTFTKRGGGGGEYTLAYPSRGRGGEGGGSFSISSNCPYKFVRYLELRYLAISLSRILQHFFCPLTRTFLQHIFKITVFATKIRMFMSVPYIECLCLFRISNVYVCSVFRMFMSVPYIECLCLFRISNVYVCSVYRMFMSVPYIECLCLFRISNVYVCSVYRMFMSVPYFEFFYEEKIFLFVYIIA